MYTAAGRNESERVTSLPRFRPWSAVPARPSMVGRSLHAINPYPQKLWITLWTSQATEVEKLGHIAYLLPW